MGFTRDAVERVVRTVFQAAGAAVIVVWVDAGSFDQIKWSTVWQVAVYAGGLALLMALVGSKVGSKNDASFQTPSE